VPRSPLAAAAMILLALAAGCRSAIGEEPTRQAQTKAEPTEVPGVPQATALGTLGCGEVADCADRCGRGCPSGVRKVPCLLDCKNQCRAKGCASAQRMFDGLTSCIALRCFIYCVTGPTPRCGECTDSKCAADTRSCKKHRC
jgi:hypothetical protein